MLPGISPILAQLAFLGELKAEAPTYRSIYEPWVPRQASDGQESIPTNITILSLLTGGWGEVRTSKEGTWHYFFFFLTLHTYLNS